MFISNGLSPLSQASNQMWGKKICMYVCIKQTIFTCSWSWWCWWWWCWCWCWCWCCTTSPDASGNSSTANKFDLQRGHVIWPCRIQPSRHSLWNTWQRLQGTLISWLFSMQSMHTQLNVYHHCRHLFLILMMIILVTSSGAFACLLEEDVKWHHRKMLLHGVLNISWSSKVRVV